MAHMTKADLAEAARTLFHDLLKGDAEDDIADIMGWDEDSFRRIKKIMMDTKVDELKSLTPEQTYVKYIIDQSTNIKELNKLINDLSVKRNHGAMVSAIRLRADITDKVLERGFDFGILKKRHQEGGTLGSGNTFVIGGIDMRVMSAPQLQDAIKTQLTELSELVNEHGEGKSILELPTGDIHYGERAIEAPEEAPHEIETPAPELATPVARKKRSID